EDAGTPGDDAGGPCDRAPRCADGVLTSCDGDVTCRLGCSPSAEARCAQMVPSNVSATLFRSDARSLSVPTDATVVFDTSACAATTVDSMVAPQGHGGAEVCVLILRDLTIATEGYFRIFGSRPVVILATGDVTIEAQGALDVSATGRDPGPGGGAGGAFSPTSGGGPGG